MKCVRCQHENRPGAKFCEECATSLARACANCGALLSPTAKFCSECAHPTTLVPAVPTASRFTSPDSYTPTHLAERILNSKAALEGERKQVTVLFADLKGSMELLADRDPEDAHKLLDPVLERMMESVHRYEGTVNQVMGDGIMALFGAPLAHEDHAVRACYAALRMQASVKQYAEEVHRTEGVPIQIRVGLNSGEVVVRSIGSDLHMDYTAVGQTTHVAARLEQMTMPGAVLISPETLALAEGFVMVTPLGPRPIKGLERPLEVYELVGAATVRSRFQAAAARGLTRFVGRDSELEQLRQALERARAGHGQVMAVVGEPGVGKSRLYWEFTHSHRAQGWLILESGSVSYGKATNYLPILELLRAYFSIEHADDTRKIREKVTGKLLSLDRQLEPCVLPILWLLDVPIEDEPWARLDPPQRRQRILDGVKRLLLRESQVQPLMVLFEDLHWIDAETQALLDSLLESLPTARVLLLVNYRPEYSHGWGSKTYYRQLQIDPLPLESAEALLDALLGSDAALAPLKRLVIERTEGNPFFVEESVRSLVETGVLAGQRGAYRVTRIVRAGPPGPGHGPGDAGGTDRPAGAGGQATAPSGRGHRHRHSLRPAPGRGRRARGPAAPGAGPAPGDRVPVRDATVPGDRVHVPARAHSRGGVRQSAHGAAARPPRADRRRDRGAVRRPPRRAGRAARPSRPPGRIAGEGGALSQAGGPQGGGAVGVPGRPGLVIAVARTGNVALHLPLAVASSAWALAQLGEASEALNRLPEGEQGLDRLAARGYVIGWNYHSLGRACLLLGRLDEARRPGRPCGRILARSPGFAAHALHLLGDIATHPDRFDVERGEAHYQKALALAEARGMRPLVAHCHLGLGKLSRRTGPREQARDHLTIATVMYREMDMRFWLEQAEAELKEATTQSL